MFMKSIDFRTVLLAKHAQHIVLIHFPIALLIVAVVFDYLSYWTKHQSFAIAAYLNLVIAAASTLPVVATGLVAWQWALEGQPLKGVLLIHLVLGCITSVLICVVFWIHTKARRNAASPLPGYRLAIEAVAVMLVGVTAHLGGILTGVTTG
jgi:uncharacterized membrane protein